MGYIGWHDFMLLFLCSSHNISSFYYVTSFETTIEDSPTILRRWPGGTGRSVFLNSIDDGTHKVIFSYLIILERVWPQSLMYEYAHVYIVALDIVQTCARRILSLYVWSEVVCRISSCAVSLN